MILKSFLTGKVQIWLEMCRFDTKGATLAQKCTDLTQKGEDLAQKGADLADFQ